jgi:hypothetical protein
LFSAADIAPPAADPTGNPAHHRALLRLVKHGPEKKRAYLKAIQKAQAGLELARVTLAGAVRRLEGP